MATTDTKKNQPKTSLELTSGADIAVQALVNHGVDTVFAYRVVRVYHYTRH